MTAPNHALTGALIGLTITNPWLALTLAFLSHFVCDAVPHYDPPAANDVQRIRSKRFVLQQVVVGAGLCVALVLGLALARPERWLPAASCAFIATSPDLFWLPRFVQIRRTRKEVAHWNWFWRFHAWVQWRTGPRFIWVEAVWFAGAGALLLAHL